MSTGLNYLIAEDHEFQRSMLASMLAELGAGNIYQAPDGNTALQIVSDPKIRVDIVICDIDMPGMDGMEFIRLLGHIGARISMIIASALERALLGSIALMARTYGIRLLGVVEKPLTPGKLSPLLRLHADAQPLRAAPGTTPASRFALAEILAGLRKDEFEPHFQPQVELASGRVVGAEALARWREPQKGIIAPYAFIPVLEDGDRIDDLMWIMLRKSAVFCRAWLSMGLDITVSVNLSATSLGDVQLAERVVVLLLEHNLEPRHLVLELTESAATTQTGTALENLARLRMRGFGLSIDDYGTGYSSMQQLTRIAFTELKIDRSFVMSATHEPSSHVILDSSLAMARKLNMKSVAEGIETRAELQMLSRMPCDMGQGYFIAKPMAGENFPDWVKGWESSRARG